MRLHQIKPKPHTVDRTEALPAITRFIGEAHDVEMVWLADGIDLGHGADFVKGLAQTIEQRPLTIVAGGLDARDGTAALGFVNAMSDLPKATTRGGTLYTFGLP